MSQALPEIPWYDRFFREEYLLFDEHPDTDEEIDFLLRLFDPGENTRILDIGCGYGRHAIPLAREGCPTVGIDRSPTMLNAARKSADPGLPLALVRADMRALPVSCTFDLAFSLFSSFGYFDDDDENFRVLQGIANALVPGGQFLLETANRDFVIRHSLPVQTYRPAGRLLVEERQFDPVTGRSRVDVTLIHNGAQTHLYHSIRLYAFTELQMLLTAAGLIVRGIWGDFQGGDYTCDSHHLILLAEKP